MPQVTQWRWHLDAGRRRVGRLMRENDLRIVRTCKYKTIPNSSHTLNIAPNWLYLHFAADRPNQKRAGNISCMWTRAGWLYLAVMIDLHSRRVVGWAVSNRLKHDLALRPEQRGCFAQARRRLHSPLRQGWPILR